MYRRVQSALFEPLISALESPSSSEPPVQKRPRLDKPTYSFLTSNACLSNPPEEGPLGVSSLKAGLLKHLFEVASDEGTRDSNRRKMYAFWKSSADDDDLDVE
jgi:ribosomal RNA-processing protein 1